MKTKEELNALKEEVETLNKKLRELNEEKLAQVTGGTQDFVIEEGGSPKEYNYYSAEEIKDFEYKK